MLFTFAPLKMVAIAQLVRASVCGTEGRGFEPHWPPRIQKPLDLGAFEIIDHLQHLFVLAFTAKILSYKGILLVSNPIGVYRYVLSSKTYL